MAGQFSGAGDGCVKGRAGFVVRADSAAIVLGSLLVVFHSGRIFGGQVQQTQRDDWNRGWTIGGDGAGYLGVGARAAGLGWRGAVFDEHFRRDFWAYQIWIASRIVARIEAELGKRHY